MDMPEIEPSLHQGHLLHTLASHTTHPCPALQKEEEEEDAKPKPVVAPGHVHIRGGSFAWDNTNLDSKANLTNITFEAKPNTLTMVGGVRPPMGAWGVAQAGRWVVRQARSLPGFLDPPLGSHALGSHNARTTHTHTGGGWRGRRQEQLARGPGGPHVQVSAGHACAAHSRGGIPLKRPLLGMHGSLGVGLLSSRHSQSTASAAIAPVAAPPSLLISALPHAHAGARAASASAAASRTWRSPRGS